MKFKTLALAGWLFLLMVYSWPAAGSDDGRAMIEDVLFAADDFAGGSGHGFVVTGAGLTMAAGATTAVYTSPVIKAPIPFNAAVPQWLAVLPDGANMALRWRTRTAAGDWSRWIDVHENDDWTLPGDPDLVGEMIAVPAADVTHQYLQFAVSFGRYQDTAAPILRRLTLTLIDSTDGPTVADMLARQAALDAGRTDTLQVVNDDYPRPTVISREVWCLDEDCDYSDDLEYAPATHLIVHHTVSSNDPHRLGGHRARHLGVPHPFP